MVLKHVSAVLRATCFLRISKRQNPSFKFKCLIAFRLAANDQARQTPICVVFCPSTRRMNNSFASFRGGELSETNLLKIEAYGLIGDTHTASPVGRNGSIDWLCLPSFDSGACFAALLDNERHGCWQLCPTGAISRVQRRYRLDTLVLETDFQAVSCAWWTACRCAEPTPP